MSERRPKPITALIAGLAKRDRGSVGRIAALAGVDRTTVSHWLSTEAERDYTVPADALAAVCDALGSVEPLRAIAEELDLELVPRSRPTTASRPLQDAVWELLGHASTVGTEVRAAVSDGIVDQAEAQKVRTAGLALRDVIDAMLSRLPS